MSSYRLHRTDRLVLTAVAEDELPEIYELHADPVVWQHLPSGRHTDPAQIRRWYEATTQRWDEDGLAYWTVRDHAGEFLGVGGCSVVDHVRWNLYYRFRPEAQGHGYASEMGRAALDAAYARNSQLPRTAFLVEHNAASKAVAERLGLQLQWRGPDGTNPDPDAVRLVYADRPLTPDQLAAVTH